MDVCKDYMVVLPAGPHFDGPELHKAVLSALIARFPDYTWQIHDSHKSRSGRFIILPALKTIPAPGEVAAKMEFGALTDFHAFLEFQFIEPTKRIN